MRRKIRGKAGWRTVGRKKVWFRSRWEANVARYFQYLKQQGRVRRWEHEPETFWFEGIKRGCVSYLPDFRVTWPDGGISYVEVKGYMDSKSKTKLKRMAKYFPEVELILIDQNYYSDIERNFKDLIKGWE